MIYYLTKNAMVENIKRLTLKTNLYKEKKIAPRFQKTETLNCTLKYI